MKKRKYKYAQVHDRFWKCYVDRRVFHAREGALTKCNRQLKDTIKLAPTYDLVNCTKCVEAYKKEQQEIELRKLADFKTCRDCGTTEKIEFSRWSSYGKILRNCSDGLEWYGRRCPSCSRNKSPRILVTPIQEKELSI